MSQDAPLRIDAKELFSPKVEDYLEVQSALQRGAEEIAPQPWLVRMIYSSWFYLSICSGIGALCAWAILEPFFDDNEIQPGGGGDGSSTIAALLMFPMVAGFVGLFLGAAEGIMCRNARRAVVSGAVGLGVGFGGGLIALIPTAIVYGTMSQIALSFWKNPAPGKMPDGIALLILMMGRAAAWAIVSIPAGLGQGIALKEKKVVFNGVLGGVMGGLIGGLLFDPISFVLTTADGQAVASRAIGLSIVGLMVGLFVGLVEGWTKTAWLLMRKGPLAGKQFVLFKDTTILGSSPKAEIYLFKDEAIEPRHAIIHNRGGRFELEDCQTPDGTYVNGIPIKKHLLQNGDQIVMGKTVLEFTLREAKG
ncbi:MAG: FHA domain-containing protein [Planctomycetaceae bacterium]